MHCLRPCVQFGAMQLMRGPYPAALLRLHRVNELLLFQVNWRKLLELSESVTDEIAKLQGGYKKKLLSDVKVFVVDVVQFRNDYLVNGPMVKGISPTEAMDRLRRYNEEFELRARKFELYSGGTCALRRLLASCITRACLIFPFCANCAPKM